MQKLDRWVTSFVKFLDSFSQILLFFLMCFFVVYIVLRFFGIVIFGTVEIAQYGCLLIVVLALARNDYKGGNITVTVLTDAVPPVWRKIIRSFALIFSVGTCLIMEYGMITYMLSKKASNALSSALKFPIWMLVALICIGFLLLVLSVICRLIQLWGNYTNITVQEAAKENEDAIGS